MLWEGLPLLLASKIQIVIEYSYIIKMFLTNTSSSVCLPKALEVTQQTNCVRHFIPECEEQLQEIQGQKEKGLLYGIPVSIKDHIGHKVLPFAPLKHPIMSQAGWRCGGTLPKTHWQQEPLTLNPCRPVACLLSPLAKQDQS